MSGDNDKATKVKGKYFDRVLDPLAIHLEDFGYRTAHLVKPMSLIFGLVTYSQSYSMTLTFLRAAFFDFIARRTDFCIPNSKVYRQFAEVLKQTQPKAIFTIGYLHWVKAAATSLGIPVIEVLHGRGYVDDPKVWLTGGSSWHPDGVISFDDTSSATLRSAFRGENLEVIDTDDFVFEFFASEAEASSPTNHSHDERLRILVTLSWGFSSETGDGAEMLSDGLLPNGLIPAIKSTRDTHDWTIRLHPVQALSKERPYYAQRRYLRQLSRTHANVHLDFGGARSIYSAMGNASHHVTSLSMSVYEAAQLGVPSLVLNLKYPGGERYFLDLESDGLLTRGEDNSESILKWIEGAPARNRSQHWSRKLSTIDIERLVEHPLLKRYP